MWVGQLSRARQPGTLCSVVVWFVLEIKEEALSYYPQSLSKPRVGWHAEKKP